MIEQRVRNRLIEYFELASSFAAQQEYERDAPIAHVPHEVIEQWADWLPHLDLYLADSAAYSAVGVEAIKLFQNVWQATANAISDGYPTLAQVIQNSICFTDLQPEFRHWQSLVHQR